ncbi:MAG: precorrin-3B synthase [Hyphomicrobiaceae bacterium]
MSAPSTQHSTDHCDQPDSDALPNRKGWCPGALRPMQTGDGLLVRIKPRNNRMSCHNARQLADLSRRYGNGIIDLTQRANLQIRGVTDTNLESLVETLSHLGLLDESVAVESVRNILVSPLAGIDPTAADLTALTAQLETALRDTPSLHALPGKFSFAVDAGGKLPLGPTTSDITLTAVPNTNLWDLEHAGSTHPVCRIETRNAVGEIVKLAQEFLRQQSATVRRMRDLANTTLPNVNKIAAGTHVIGRLSLDEECELVALGCAFGRITADQLSQIATAAENVDCSTLHLTPWHSIFIPCQTSDTAAIILSTAKQVGLITELTDARRSIAACPGHPACRQGQTSAMADAETLSQIVNLEGNAFTPDLIHVSGCAKGCARQQASVITLIGNAGCYDLVINGNVGDQPSQTNIAPANVGSVIHAVLDTNAQNKKSTTSGAQSIG